MGRSLVRAALVHNDSVCAIGQSHTTDTPESMRSVYLSSCSDAASPETYGHQQNYPPLLCDMRVRASVSSALQTVLARFGSIDIVASCSGHGIIGTCGGQSEADIRDQFETNFMGTLSIIQLTWS